MLVGIIGCASNKGSVSQPVVNPSGLSEIPFETGEMVMIYTKSKINISSWHVDMVSLVITDVNPTRIMGEVDFVCCDYEYGKEDVEGETVEIDIINIAKIKLAEKWVKKDASKPSLGPQIIDAVLFNDHIWGLVILVLLVGI